LILTLLTKQNKGVARTVISARTLA